MGEIRTTSSTGGQKGVKLARFDLIPVGPLTELAEHYGVGATKYDNHQWRQGYEWGKSYAALMRHLTAWWAGFDFDVCSNDPEGCSHVDADGKPFVAAREDACFNHTGSHHLAAVAWHAFCLLEFKDAHPEHDDRHKAPTEPAESLDEAIDKWCETLRLGKSMSVELELADIPLETLQTIWGHGIRMVTPAKHNDLSRKTDALSSVDPFVDGWGREFYWSPTRRRWRKVGSHKA